MWIYLKDSFERFCPDLICLIVGYINTTGVIMLQGAFSSKYIRNTINSSVKSLNLDELKENFPFLVIEGKFQIFYLQKIIKLFPNINEIITESNFLNINEILFFLFSKNINVKSLNIVFHSHIVSTNELFLNISLFDDIIIVKIFDRNYNKFSFKQFKHFLKMCPNLIVFSTNMLRITPKVLKCFGTMHNLKVLGLTGWHDNHVSFSSISNIICNNPYLRHFEVNLKGYAVFNRDDINQIRKIKRGIPSVLRDEILAVFIQNTK